MQKAALLKLFKPVEFKTLKLELPPSLLAAFSEKSQTPEALKEAKYITAEQVVHGHREVKKGKEAPAKQPVREEEEHKLFFVVVNKNGKTFRKGPFILFYEMEQEGKRVDWNEEIWYYKKDKDMFGPVSSYNMDRLYFSGEVAEDSKVGFTNYDKFIRLSKVINKLKENPDLGAA